MTEANPLTTRLEGPAPAMEVAVDLVKRSLWVLPVAMGIGFAGWRGDGAWSSLYGLVIVAVNFFLAAWILQVTGRISVALMAGGALFGFLLRLGLIMAAVLLVRDASWVSLVPLGVTLIAAHLGLLFWELRYVSGSLAFPGLKPAPRDQPASVSSTSPVSHQGARP
jgi:hypothetical protein